MSALGMRPPKSTGHPVPGFRIAAVAALFGAIALLAAHPVSARTMVRQSRTLPPTTSGLDRSRKARKAQRHAQRRGAATQQPGTTGRARRRAGRRAPDPGQLVVAQGDGSPVLESAAEFLGRPYRFGSEGLAFDCSGFVRAVFAKIGVELPRSAREQFSEGERVDRDDLEPGDLVFFRTYRRTASHVGIYVGDDKFVHAASRGGQVQVDSLDQAYYARRYLGARRVEI
jgi:cell wall-associated NlpC family hydrolase